MGDNQFVLGTRKDVESFEDRMQAYSTSTTLVAESHISLVNAWDLLAGRQDGYRVFSALLDVYLTVHFVFQDLLSVVAVWNNRFSPGKLEGGRILDSQEKFVGKMEIYRYTVAYILRYRAAWDKILGFFVLFWAPDSYDEFMKANSKKKAFKKFSTKLGISEYAVSMLIEKIQTFDDMFRTSEAHGVSSIRKWTLSMETLNENPSTELIGYWNWLNHATKTVGSIFNEVDSNV